MLSRILTERNNTNILIADAAKINSMYVNTLASVSMCEHKSECRTAQSLQHLAAETGKLWPGQDRYLV